MGDIMDQFIAELKEKYDYIILDTPPIGLVADAIELVEYVDATLYVVRQDYTKKGMLSLINDKFKRKELSNISFIYNFYNQKENMVMGTGMVTVTVMGMVPMVTVIMRMKRKIEGC